MTEEERERVTEEEREKTNKTRGDYANTIWEQRYVREPIEAKCSKFWLLILLRSSGI